MFEFSAPAGSDRRLIAQGAAMQNGAGPYTIPSDGQQLFEYAGATALVVVNLPTPPFQQIPQSGFIVIVTNRGSGAATLVPKYNTVAIDATPIALGESRSYIYIGDILTYVRIGISVAPVSSNPWTQVMRTATLLRTSGTVADGVLKFAVTTGLRYRFNLSVLFLQGALTADFRYGFSAPALTSWAGADRGYPAGGAAYAGTTDVAIIVDRTLGVGATATIGELQYSGIFVPSANGTLDFLWGSSANANQSLLGGSYLEYQVV